MTCNCDALEAKLNTILSKVNRLQRKIDLLESELDKKIEKREANILIEAAKRFVLSKIPGIALPIARREVAPVSKRAQKALGIALAVQAAVVVASALAKQALFIGRAAKALANVANSKAVKALGKIIGLASQIANILSIIGTLVNFFELRRVERRIDSLERQLNKSFNDLINAIMAAKRQLSKQIKDLGRKVGVADRRSIKALNKAIQGFNTAISARAKAVSANIQALNAIRKSNRAFSQALQATAIATATSLVANQALNVGQNAFNRTLNNARGIRNNGSRISQNTNAIRKLRNRLNNLKPVQITNEYITQNITNPIQKITQRFNTIQRVNTTQTIREEMDITPILQKLDRNNKNILTGNSLVTNSLNLINKVQNTVDKAWEFARLDKVINVLTLMTTLHNAAFLSRNILNSITDAASLVIQSLGIKDAKGSPIDIGQVLGQTVNDWMGSIFGTQTWENMQQTWASYNRIYQSASNILWSVRSLVDGARDIIELTAENVGRIGNALKRFGAVGQRSYPWMAESARAHDRWSQRVRGFIEQGQNIEDAADVLAAISGNVIDIQETTLDIQRQKQDFLNEIENASPIIRPDNAPVETSFDNSNAVSIGQDVEESDFLPAETEV